LAASPPRPTSTRAKLKPQLDSAKAASYLPNSVLALVWREC
jgi:hypothetical protein